MPLPCAGNTALSFPALVVRAPSWRGYNGKRPLSAQLELLLLFSPAQLVGTQPNTADPPLSRIQPPRLELLLPASLAISPSFSLLPSAQFATRTGPTLKDRPSPLARRRPRTLARHRHHCNPISAQRTLFATSAGSQSCQSPQDSLCLPGGMTAVVLKPHRDTSTMPGYTTTSLEMDDVHTPVR